MSLSELLDDVQKSVNCTTIGESSCSTMKATMKAIVMSNYGTSDVLSVVQVPIPQIKKHEVLIKVEAAGLNRLDHYIREGTVNPDLSFPFILGSDAVGFVSKIGSDVTKFEIGDRVIPMPGYPVDIEDEGADILATSRSYAIRGLAENGAYAQYMTVPEAWLLPEKTGLPAVELATLPMPLITAVRAVRHVGEVKQGQHVLIHAGASGTGSTMVQIAKLLGAKVATTLRSAHKIDFVKSIGADLVIMEDDTDGPEKIHLWSKGKGLDVVINNLGGSSLAKSLEWVNPLGIVVLMGNVLGLESTIPVRGVFFSQKQIRGTLMGNRQDLEWGLEQVTQGNIKITLDRVFKPEQAIEAHNYLVEGKALGNSVFDFSDNN